MIAERAGQDVVAVADGAAAFELRQSIDIDLIISDCSMPVPSRSAIYRCMLG